jgi:hypothetical protein
MRVDHDTKALELLEVPINRRQSHIGSEGVDRGGQVLGGAMSGAREQATEQEPS